LRSTVVHVWLRRTKRPLALRSANGKPTPLPESASKATNVIGPTAKLNDN